MQKPFLLGTHAFNGRPRYLKPEELRTHALLVGGTRRGKSKFLEHASHYFIQSKIPHVVLDPAGDTVKSILAYVSNEVLASRIIYIDVNEAVERAVFPLNFLQRTALDTATHSSRIMAAIAKVFHEEHSETKPRLERRERATLMALIEAGYTLADMLEFLNISDGGFRKQVLSKVSDHYVLTEWAEYESLQRRADREMMLESCLNRAAKIILNEPVRRCLGAQDFGLDWESIIREGKVVLVNLQPRLVSRECMELIGVLLVDHLVNYGTQLEQPSKHPFYVLCDELDELATPDLGYSMQALAKRNIYIWGFVQYLEQLKNETTTSKLYHSAMTNCDLKIAFHTSYEDAKLLVHELFSGLFRGDVIKHEIDHTVLIPKEAVRTVLTRSETESETETSSQSEGSASMDSSFSTSGDGFGSANTSSYGDPYGTDRFGFVDSAFTSSGAGFGSGESKSKQKGKSTSSSRARGSAQSDVPFYEYLERQELSSRAYYSIGELEEKYIAFIQCQPQRHVQVKVRDNTAIPIIIPFVDTPRVRVRDIQKVIERSNKRYTLLPAEVDKLTETRRQLKRLPKPKDTDTDDDRWQ